MIILFYSNRPSPLARALTSHFLLEVILALTPYMYRFTKFYMGCDAFLTHSADSYSIFFVNVRHIPVPCTTQEIWVHTFAATINRLVKKPF